MGWFGPLSTAGQPIYSPVSGTIRWFDPSTGGIAPMFAEAIAAADAVDRETWRLLLDLRQTKGRNDGEFEKQIAPLRTRLEQGFAKVAVLVRSMVGRLQVERHAREDGVNLRVFNDEAEAMAWLSSSD